MKRKMSRLEFTQTPFEGRFAAVYVRVSSNEIKRGNKEKRLRQVRESVQTQESDGIALAKSRGWEYRVFKGDCNLSGFEDTNRPDLTEIIKLIKAGRIHTLITRDPYRISRNVSLSSDLLYKTLIPHGCNLICFDANIDISTSEGQDAFIGFGQKGQNQLIYISKTSLRGKTKLAESGGYSTKPVYGWKMASREHNDVIQVPEQVAVVQRVFAEYASGKSIGKIIEGLKRDKIIRPVAGNSDWSVGDVGRMMRKVQYIGRITFQGKTYPSPYTPIIDQATWDIAQSRLDQNAALPKKAKVSPWMASGILKCGLCADRAASGDHPRYENLHLQVAPVGANSWQPRFKCNESARYRKATCPGVSIGQRTIDDFIRKIIGFWAVNGVKDNVDTATIEQAISDSTAEIAKLNRKKESLIATFVESGGSPSDLATVTRKINTLIESLNRKVVEDKTRIEAISNRDATQAIDQLNKWDALEVQMKRELIRRVIERILVYPDKIMVFTRMNPTQGISFQVKKVWKTKVIVTDSLDQAAMGWQMAIDFSTEREVIKGKTA